MNKLRFSKEHEWIRMSDDALGVIGITDHAQQQLGDIVFVDLPEQGLFFKRHSEVAVIESVKAASEIYAMVDGQVKEVNHALTENPSLVNQEPYAQGWLFTAMISDPSQLDDLMDESAYQEYLESL